MSQYMATPQSSISLEGIWEEMFEEVRSDKPDNYPEQLNDYPGQIDRYPDPPDNPDNHLFHSDNSPNIKQC